MLQKLGLFVALCAAWMLWSGYFKPLLLGLGLFSVLTCVYLAMRMRKTDGEGPGFSIIDHIHQLATYWPWLLVEIAKSNIDVARIVLAPKIDVDPVMIKVKASQATGMGRRLGRPPSSDTVYRLPPRSKRSSRPEANNTASPVVFQPRTRSKPGWKLNRRGWPPVTATT